MRATGGAWESWIARVRAPPHAAAEAQDAQERDRLGVVELSLAKIAAELVRLGDLEIERQESVQENAMAPR